MKKKEIQEYFCSWNSMNLFNLFVWGCNIRLFLLFIFFPGKRWFLFVLLKRRISFHEKFSEFGQFVRMSMQQKIAFNFHFLEFFDGKKFYWFGSNTRSIEYWQRIKLMFWFHCCKLKFFESLAKITVNQSLSANLKICKNY